MQLPIMSDKELKRASAVSQFNPSASSSSAAANVPELLPTWSDDPEMNASESFEAENELRNHFPQYEIPTKVTDKLTVLPDFTFFLISLKQVSLIFALLGSKSARPRTNSRFNGISPESSVHGVLFEDI